jgi:anaerobic selenocysteine-containing dehydrogenase
MNHTTDEYLAMMVTGPFPDASLGGISPTLTWDRLKNEKVIRANVPYVPSDPYAVGNPEQPFLDFTVPSGRLEFYAENYASIPNGQSEAMARYVDPFWITKGQKNGFPLQFISARSRFSMQSQFIDDTCVQQLLDKVPVIRMNPVDADKRGIKEGDMVEAFNDRKYGHLQGPAHLSQITPPGVVMVYFAWPKAAWKLGHPCYLMAPNSMPETNDALANKLGKFAPTWGTDGYDMIWDQYCDVKKV